MHRTVGYFDLLPCCRIKMPKFSKFWLALCSAEKTQRTKFDLKFIKHSLLSRVWLPHFASKLKTATFTQLGSLLDATPAECCRPECRALLCGPEAEFQPTL